ncbi:hypothetical protein N2152v2_009953 [Parachlorella kessleri]
MDSQLAARACPSLRAHHQAFAWGSSSCASSFARSLSRSLRGKVRSAGVPARAEQPCGGSSSDSGSSSSGKSDPSPLHACLLRYGITNLAAFSAPKHLALSQEAVHSNVEPKLAALAAEGLSPKQMARILAAHDSALSCNHAKTFLPNLQLLQRIAAHADYRPHPKTPHLTAAGKLLADSAAGAARYLSRDPSKVQQLLQWLKGSLGVGLEQLAACNNLFNALMVSAAAADAVCLSLQQQQVSARQVAHMLLKQPTIFGYRPGVLSAQVALLQRHLDLDAAAALEVVIAHPRLLFGKLESSLPPLLRFLDGYMGEVGAGRRLVRALPSLGTSTAATVERSVGNLAAMGYSQQQIRGIIYKHPGLLSRDINSPLQRQKLDWIGRESPWTLDDFLSVPTYLLYSTCRLAARLALLRRCGLDPPSTPSCLALPSSVTFMAAVRKQLAKQGRELPWASWEEWEEAWLRTEEGREWGFPPLKD